MSQQMSVRRTVAMIRLIVIGGLITLLTLPVVASQPASGTLLAGSTSALNWTGTGIGGASPEAETTCIEGVNCDTFLLTFGGTAADWNGKSVRVSLSWLLPLTDYTSMVVLADDVFEKRGIARNNKERIGVERGAQATRVTAPPVNRRADHQKPMFNGRSHGLKGGGAFDPMMVLLALTAALAALHARR